MLVSFPFIQQFQHNRWCYQFMEKVCVKSPVVMHCLLCRFTQCLRVNFAHFEPLCLLISSRSSWQLAQVRQP
ncbi:hypothetical protein SCOCK_1180002 [Actinacidiphila cocklensis]|uniref:Uncharacterized protein n=1 Tax=Actinacidiphila cocklensis TaxID=887465 RepID=A0A9W4GQA2_9ACTN|nr:hypothetical protein SCOCK_1180002 [Actinacidiphila cocklensis]